MQQKSWTNVQPNKNKSQIVKVDEHSLTNIYYTTKSQKSQEKQYHIREKNNEITNCSRIYCRTRVG